MRALVVEQLAADYGGCVLKEVPTPEPGAGEVRLRVKAAAVNFPDLLQTRGEYQHKPPLPFIPGMEVAGEVDAVGEGVTRFKPGDAVVGGARVGGFSEFAVSPAIALREKPEHLSFSQAAGYGTAYLTAYVALVRRAQLEPGEWVLVHGAAGGVGLAAVELGKAMGARVIAACSTQEKVDLAKKHGADDGVVYGRGPFDRDGQKQLAELFKTACGPKGADVIYDAVGGDYAEPAFRSIAWEGRYLVIGFAAGDIPRLPLNLPLLKGADIVGVFWGAFTNNEPANYRADVEELLELYSQGKIRPHVSEKFPLEKAADAITHLASRKAMGKVVVTID